MCVVGVSCSQVKFITREFNSKLNNQQQIPGLGEIEVDMTENEVKDFEEGIIEAELHEAEIEQEEWANLQN